MTITIRTAEFPADRDVVRTLFTAYTDALPAKYAAVLAQQNFGAELNALPGKYAAENDGALFIALGDETGRPVGCVGLRKLELHGTVDDAVRPRSEAEAEANVLESVDSTSLAKPKEKVRACEMKRLFADPTVRGKGLGRKLVGAVVEEAKRLGYEEMRLDTAPEMTPAIKLYESVGFVDCERYNEAAFDNFVFLALDLRKG